MVVPKARYLAKKELTCLFLAISLKDGRRVVTTLGIADLPFPIALVEAECVGATVANGVEVWVAAFREQEL